MGKPWSILVQRRKLLKFSRYHKHLLDRNTYWKKKLSYGSLDRPVSTVTNSRLGNKVRVHTGSASSPPNPGGTSTGWSVRGVIKNDNSFPKRHLPIGLCNGHTACSLSWIIKRCLPELKPQSHHMLSHYTLHAVRTVYLRVSVQSPNKITSLKQHKIIYGNNSPTRCNSIQFIYICQLLYMFRVIFSPITRSS